MEIRFEVKDLYDEYVLYSCRIHYNVIYGGGWPVLEKFGKKKKIQDSK